MSFLCLICRHEDGTVRFWDASGVALTPLYKLSTASVFHTDCDPSDDSQDPSNDPDVQQEEEWPPFRKVRPEESRQMKSELRVSSPDPAWDLLLLDCGKENCVFYTHRHTHTPFCNGTCVTQFSHLIVFICLVC